MVSLSKGMKVLTMNPKDAARLALGTSIVIGCAASIDSMRAESRVQYEISGAIANGADLVTAGLGVSLGVERLLNRPAPRRTVKRNPRKSSG